MAKHVRTCLEYSGVVKRRECLLMLPLGLLFCRTIACALSTGGLTSDTVSFSEAELSEGVERLAKRPCSAWLKNWGVQLRRLR